MYSAEQAAKAGTGNTGRSNLFLKTSANAQLFSFSGRDQHLLGVVRPFPCRDPETGQLLPYRFPAGYQAADGTDLSGQITPWVWCVSNCMMYIGQPSVSFIAVDQEEHLRDQTAFSRTPVAALIRAVKSARYANRRTHGFSEFAAYRGQEDIASYFENRMLSNPTARYFVQGAVLECASTRAQNVFPTGIFPNQPTAVVVMSKLAGESLMRKLAEVDAQGNPVVRDVVDWKNGQILVVYDARYGAPDGQSGGQSQQQAWQAAPPVYGAQTAGGGNRVDHQVMLVPQWRGNPAAIPDNLIESASQHVLAWKDVLYVPSHEEQVEILIESFPADVLEYAWQNHPEWLSNPRLQAKLKATVRAPGAQIPTGQQAQAAPVLPQPVQVPVPQPAATAQPQAQPQPQAAPATGAWAPPPAQAPAEPSPPAAQPAATPQAPSQQQLPPWIAPPGSSSVPQVDAAVPQEPVQPQSTEELAAQAEKLLEQAKNWGKPQGG